MTTTNKTPNIFSAMLKARSEFEKIVKTETAKGEKFSWQYANLEQVIDKTYKGLTDNGLVIIQFPINEEDRVGVLTIIAHIESGEILEKPVTTKYFRQDPQGIGMLITYFRRYAYMSVCGLAPEDDDAQSAMPIKTTTHMEGGTMTETLPVCPEHGVEYAKYSKDGKSWYSHKLENGGYCNKK